MPFSGQELPPEGVRELPQPRRERYQASCEIQDATFGPTAGK